MNVGPATNVHSAHGTSSPPRLGAATWPPPAPRPTQQRGIGAVLLPLRLFLAAGWLRAAVEKVIDPDWWSGTKLDGFLTEQRDHMLSFFVPFADNVVSPLSIPVAWFVVQAQLAIGLCLLLGHRVREALVVGLVLNTTFVLAGAVNPSAFYIMMQLVLLLALARHVPWRTSLGRAAEWLTAAALFLPFGQTLDPTLVIEDPALVLSFSCVLAGLGTLATGDWWRSPLLRRYFDTRTIG